MIVNVISVIVKTAVKIVNVINVIVKTVVNLVNFKNNIILILIQYYFNLSYIHSIIVFIINSG